jgi:ABC-type branched-subunit amino acid transport system substrate-binding protein
MAPTLRKLLDDSAIKHRVIVISACYSGGFIDGLKDDNNLVITAAAADKNSFGCDNESDFTYFGKAYFDEALRKTWSFTEAFEIAKPMIAAREKEQDYTPSEPQMALGRNIAPVLEALVKERQQTAVTQKN